MTKAKKKGGGSRLIGKVVILSREGEQLVEHWQGMPARFERDPSPLTKLYNVEGEVLDTWREDGTCYVQVLPLSGDHAGSPAVVSLNYVQVIRGADEEDGTKLATVTAPIYAALLVINKDTEADSSELMEVAMRQAHDLLHRARP